MQYGIYVAMPGYGQHDVIIESPALYQDITTMSTQEVEIVVETYHKHYLELEMLPVKQLG